MILVCVACWSLTHAQTSDDREVVLHSLAVLYGSPLSAKEPQFPITPHYVLLPTFSDEGLLIEISIEPKSDAFRTSKLSKTEFELILATLTSIKSLGAFEEGPYAIFVSGGRAHLTQRYKNAYLQTEEPLALGEPRPIHSARIYYLHSVTGVPKIGRDDNPDDTNNYRQVCVDGQYYKSSAGEFLKLWSKPNERQTVELAGPTGFCSPDLGLFKKALTAIEQQRFDVARLTLETLTNTYPDSECATKAKELLSDPRIARCGETWIVGEVCGTVSSDSVPH